MTGAPSSTAMPVTEGSLLDGRVRYAQPAEGFRSGIEPVLLAAAVPARPGERVLEAGSGAGAGLLCLAARVPGVIGLGVEIDPAMTALANANARSNALSSVRFVTGDITSADDLGRFDHACANPPYHAPAGTPSPMAARATAKIAWDGLLRAWITAMAQSLRHRGTLSLILPVAVMPLCLGVLDSVQCGSIAVLPLWPRMGQPAKLGLLRAIRGGRGPFRLLSGFALHDGAAYSTKAQEILRLGQGLEF